MQSHGGKALHLPRSLRIRIAWGSLAVVSSLGWGRGQRESSGADEACAQRGHEQYTHVGPEAGASPPSIPAVSRAKSLHGWHRTPGFYRDPQPGYHCLPELMVLLALFQTPVWSVLQLRGSNVPGSSKWFLLGRLVLSQRTWQCRGRGEDRKC